jgi:hypothetical protein
VDPLRREFARREARDLLANASAGTRVEGIMRVMLLLHAPHDPSDERIHRALRAVHDELPVRQRITPPEMRQITRRQALLIRTDRAAAVRGLATIFAASKERAMTEAAFRKAVAAVGVRLDMTPARSPCCSGRTRAPDPLRGFGLIDGDGAAPGVPSRVAAGQTSTQAAPRSPRRRQAG